VPIEIRELHIRVAVTAPQETGPDRPAPAGADGDPEQIVALCVERVMRLLADRAER
jgi:hypothetical protein